MLHCCVSERSKSVDCWSHTELQQTDDLAELAQLANPGSELRSQLTAMYMKLQFSCEIKMQHSHLYTYLAYCNTTVIHSYSIISCNSILMMHDLSAAFDTVDHVTPIRRPEDIVRYQRHCAHVVCIAIWRSLAIRSQRIYKVDVYCCAHWCLTRVGYI